MSLSPRCAARSRRSKALISLVGPPVLVESGMLDLGSCATPVVPEMGERHKENPPHLGRRRPRLDPRTPSTEITPAPPIATLLLAQAPPSLRSKGENTMATNGCRLSLLPSRPSRLPFVSGTG
jgi:hypothetical protein